MEAGEDVVLAIPATRAIVEAEVGAEVDGTGGEDERMIGFDVQNREDALAGTCRSADERKRADRRDAKSPVD